MQSIYFIEKNDDLCVAQDKCQDTPKMSFANNTHYLHNILCVIIVTINCATKEFVIIKIV